MSESFVSVRDLVKTYKMGSTEVHALNGVSLEIDPGTFTVLMGPSGSGKSTLLNMIGGLDWPTSGSILVDGSQAVLIRPRESAADTFKNEILPS